jgi:hypothetical protein
MSLQTEFADDISSQVTKREFGSMKLRALEVGATPRRLALARQEKMASKGYVVGQALFEHNLPHGCGNGRSPEGDPKSRLWVAAPGECRSTNSPARRRIAMPSAIQVQFSYRLRSSPCYFAKSSRPKTCRTSMVSPSCAGQRCAHFTTSSLDGASTSQ